MMAPLPYQCIHCGNEEPQVYKTYAKGNLIKLLPCTKCGELIDKYVEYDPIIVVINLVLQNEMAYRHILHNTVFEGFWKLGIVFLFCEAYCFWCFQKGMETESTAADFYEIELNFYRVLLRTVISTCLFHGMMLLSSWFGVWHQKRDKSFSYFTLWKGLCLTGFSEVFELLALIWVYTDLYSRILFVKGLFLLSNMRSYEVVTGGSKFEAASATVFSFIFQKVILTLYDEYFPV